MREAEDAIQDTLTTHARLAERVADDEKLLADVGAAAELVSDTLDSGGRVLACGNGGSAADAQHIVAELAGRYRADREPLPALALTVNPSTVTAVANDYGYDDVFARQVRGLATEDDVLLAISTSGLSQNVILAAEAANEVGASTVALTGASGGKLAAVADVAVQVPSDETPRIQEIHILVGHALCRVVEERIVGETR